MKSPQVLTCCGLNLKHGTIIIGVLQSILSFMGLILSAAYVEHPNELLHVSSADTSIVSEHVLKSLLIALAVGNAVACIFSILIIFGALTNRPLLLLPYITFYLIAWCAFVLLTLVAIICYSGPNPLGFVGGHLIFAVVVSSIAAYKLLVVSSYYNHLKSLNFQSD